MGRKPMIVCQCTGVTDRAIRKAVRDGASNRNDVVRACTAGKTCGGCVPAIDEIIEAEQGRIMRSGLATLELATG
ncbi:MAG: (2Fe-2S)-binding protein [Myxococcales bacterium]|jgi:bacterioferritin-associated ferredoxin|nr:(2Fe-2S)-binding protein [Myxococcales bacterium]